MKPRAFLAACIVALSSVGPANTDWKTPKDYGAVGDGVANDVAAIQAALNANTVVNLEGSTYRIASSVSIPAGRKLLGPGVLVADFDTGTATVTNAALQISADDVELRNVSIHKRFVDGSLASGVRAQGASNLRMESVIIEGYSARPVIRLAGCHNFQISGSKIGGSVLNTAAEIISEPVAGIYLDESSDGLLTDNTINSLTLGPAALGDGYLSYGIFARQSPRLAILSNEISVIGEGIHFVDSRDATVSGNNISSAWVSGIGLRRSSFIGITGNNIENAFQGISLSGDAKGSGDGCVDPEAGAEVPLTGVVGSVIGGIENPENNGDSLTRLGNGDLTDRVSILQNGSGAFSFVVDLLAETRFSDLSLVSTYQYREGGQFIGGSVTLAVSSSPTGPFVDAGGGILECTRPPATEMVGENAGACATLSESRRVVLPSPITGRYVRVTGSYCLDNAVLIAEAYANHGPIVHRMRPLANSYQNFPRVPALMTDGNPSTYYDPALTAGTVDVDVAPYPVTLERVRIVGRSGALSGLPRTGSIYVSAADSPDELDSLVTTFDESPVSGEIVVDLPAGIRGRYMRVAWNTLQGAGDSRTQIAEIKVDTSAPCLPQGADFTLSSNGNAITGNVILNPGSHGVLGGGGVPGLAAVGIDLSGNASRNIITNNVIADRQSVPTMEVGIRTTDAGVANVITDNISTYSLAPQQPYQLWFLF